MEDRKQKILIADDEENILEAVTMVLQDRYSVTPAKRGDEALSIYREGRFDLVISDIRMPGLNGIEFFRSVKRILPAQKFLFTSVSGMFYDDPDGQKILTDGADGFLSKPYRIADLVSLIEKILADC